MKLNINRQKIIETINDLIKKNIDFTWSSLTYDKFRKDEEICLLAIKDRSGNFDFIDRTLKNSPEFIQKALEINPFVFPHLPYKYQMDRDFTLNLIHREPIIALFCQHFKNDKEIAITALSLAREDKYDHYFSHFKSFKNDDEFILTGLKKSINNLQFASQRLQKLLANETDPVAALNAIVEKKQLDVIVTTKKVRKNKRF